MWFRPYFDEASAIETRSYSIQKLWEGDIGSSESLYSGRNLNRSSSRMQAMERMNSP